MRHTTSNPAPGETIDWSKCRGCGGETEHFEAKLTKGAPTDGSKCKSCGLKVYVNSKASLETFGRSVSQPE